MHFSDTVLVYENIYNQELETRRHLDNKVGQYMTFFLSNVTLLAIQSKWIITHLFPSFLRIDSECFKLKNLLMAIFFCVATVMLIIQFVAYYKCFFRSKKNYLEVPVEEIRNWYISIGKLKKHNGVYYNFENMTLDDQELYSYIRDSYLRCAMANRKTNQKRHSAFIWFENAVFLGFTIEIINYYLIYMEGGLAWIVS